LLRTIVIASLNMSGSTSDTVDWLRHETRISECQLMTCCKQIVILLPVSVSDWQTTGCRSSQRDTLHWPVVATTQL